MLALLLGRPYRLGSVPDTVVLDPKRWVVNSALEEQAIRGRAALRSIKRQPEERIRFVLFKIEADILSPVNHKPHKLDTCCKVGALVV
jgi:hypothetical protein